MDPQAHLLFERAAQEAAQRMGLPASGFPQLLERSAAGPIQKGQDLVFLGAAPGRARLAGAFGLGVSAGQFIGANGARWFGVCRRCGGLLV
jgi:hypothetical protein